MDWKQKIKIKIRLGRGIKDARILKRKSEQNYKFKDFSD